MESEAVDVDAPRNLISIQVWEQLDENKNGKVSYGEFSRACVEINCNALHAIDAMDSMAWISLVYFLTEAWASDRLADVAVDDINYTSRSNVDVGAIQAKAQAKIGA